MYAVVGCSECQSLWIVEGRPETTTCPRCSKRHQFDRLKQFVATDDEDEAREVRSAMLAADQDQSAAYERLDSFSELGDDVEAVGLSDEEILAAHGIDADAVEAAGAAATATRERKSRRERVLEAVETLEEPTEAAVVEYATDRGVPAEYVRSALAKLATAGEIAETKDGYRML